MRIKAHFYSTSRESRFLSMCIYTYTVYHCLFLTHYFSYFIICINICDFYHLSKKKKNYINKLWETPVLEFEMFLRKREQFRSLLFYPDMDPKISTSDWPSGHIVSPAEPEPFSSKTQVAEQTSPGARSGCHSSVNELLPN